MTKKTIYLSLLYCLFFNIQHSQAQFTAGLHSLSISATNTEFGLPFLQFFPIHPGIDIGITFLENNQTHLHHKVQANIGFIHHNLLLNAPYLKSEYALQVKIKETVGFDVGIGLGYLHAFYPGQGYAFNEEMKLYEEAQVQEGFFTINAGFGITWLKSEKLQPFMRYDAMMLGSPDLVLALFKVGVWLPFVSL